MATNYKKTLCLITILMLILTLLSSFAFAVTDKDKEFFDENYIDSKIEDKYDYIDYDSKTNKYIYKNEIIKNINDLNRKELKVENSKGKLEFLDVGSITLSESDYKINKNVIAFKSEKYITDKVKDKLPDFAKPVLVEDRVAIAKLTFNLSDDEWDLGENETSLAFIYKYDGFTDDEELIKNEGYFVGVEFVNNNILEFYADSFSSFAVITLQTNVPISVDHAGKKITPSVTLQIDNPDNDQFTMITQAKDYTVTTYSSYGSQVTQGSWNLGTYSLNQVTLPQTHIRYRYRVAVLHDGTMYYPLNGPTFDMGVVVTTSSDIGTITDTTAVVEGQLGDSLNGYSSIGCGFKYRVAGTSSWSTTGETNLNTLYADYTQTLTGLSPATDYEYSAYCYDARTGFDILAGGNMDNFPSDIQEFTTTGTLATEPQVTTLSATSVGDTTATIRGDLTDLGDETSVTGRLYHRKVGASVWTTNDQTLSATGIYTKALTGLDSCTNYEFQAGVAFGLDMNFGSTLTFKTTGCPTGGLLTDIEAYYKLDETTGTNANDEVGTNDGAVTGATWTTGKINNGLDFDGSNDYVNLPNLLNGNTAYSIYGWFNVDSLAVQMAGWGFWLDNYNLIDLRFGTDGSLINYNRIGATSDPVISSTGLISTGSWYNIVVTNDGSTQTLYLNGNSVATTTLTTGTIASLTSSQIGNNRDGSYFNGKIDEVGIWSKALTADEVEALYNEDTGKDYSTFATVAEPYTVDTLSATNVGTKTANLVGEITSMGDSTDLTVGFQYKKSTDTEWILSATQTKSTIGTFGVNQGSLSPGTEYTYRAYAENGDIVFGDEVTFTTSDVLYPTFLTLSSNAVTQDSIIMRGELLSLEDYSEVELTFAWRNGTEGLFTKIDYEEYNLVFDEPTIYTMDLTNLTINTIYQYRMIARVDGTTELVGNTITVATLPFVAPIVNLVGFSDVTTTSAKFIGEITNISEAQPNYKLNFLIGELGGVVVYDDTNVEVITTEIETPYLHEEVVTGLTPNTDYVAYFKLVYTVSGVEYTQLSSIGTFKTTSNDIVDSATIEGFFDSFTAGNNTLKFIVALVLIIGMFIMGFQLTNTIIGGSIFGLMGLVLSVVIGLIGVWVLIVLGLMVIAPFLFKLFFART